MDIGISRLIPLAIVHSPAIDHVGDREDISESAAGNRDSVSERAFGARAACRNGPSVKSGAAAVPAGIATITRTLKCSGTGNRFLFAVQSADAHGGLIRSAALCGRVYCRYLVVVHLTSYGAPIIKATAQ
jgi:hypothetical protein